MGRGYAERGDVWDWIGLEVWVEKGDCGAAEGGTKVLLVVVLMSESVEGCGGGW